MNSLTYTANQGSTMSRGSEIHLTETQYQTPPESGGRQSCRNVSDIQCRDQIAISRQGFNRRRLRLRRQSRAAHGEISEDVCFQRAPAGCHDALTSRHKYRIRPATIFRRRRRFQASSRCLRFQMWPAFRHRQIFRLL